MLAAALFTIAKLWKQPSCPPLLKNGLRKYDIYIQWNFTQLQRRMKFCHSQVNGWNWKTSYSVKLARLRRPKAMCSLSYVKNRTNTNAAILRNTGHTKGRSTTGGVG
jgi:hypothetical protein